MSEHNAMVGSYNAHPDAEAAVKALQKSGCDMQKLSIVGKDDQTEEHVSGYDNAGDRMQCCGTRGAFWGGLWGLLFGSALFVISGIGPIIRSQRQPLEFLGIAPWESLKDCQTFWPRAHPDPKALRIVSETGTFLSREICEEIQNLKDGCVLR